MPTEAEAFSAVREHRDEIRVLGTLALPVLPLPSQAGPLHRLLEMRNAWRHLYLGGASESALWPRSFGFQAAPMSLNSSKSIGPVQSEGSAAFFKSGEGEGEGEGQMYFEVCSWNLDGSQMDPSVTSSATGMAALYLAVPSFTVVLYVQHDVDDATGIRVRGVHASESDVIINLPGGGSSPILHTFSELELEDLEETEAIYIEVMSTGHSGGEIRGEAPECDFGDEEGLFFEMCMFPLDGDQMDPPVTTSATGMARLYLHIPSFEAYIEVEHDVSSPIDARIRGVRTGQSDVIINLPGDGISPVSSFIDVEDSEDLDEAEAVYVEILSTGHTVGEIRGLAPICGEMPFESVLEYCSWELDGDQMDPSVTTTATGTATVYVTVPSGMAILQVVHDVSDATGARLRGLRIGQGDLIIDLEGAASPVTYYLSEGELDALDECHTVYTEVLSTTHSAGEIGGLVPDCEAGEGEGEGEHDHSLVITVEGTGDTNPSAGIYGYDDQAIVSLQAITVPGSGYAFSHWAGDLDSNSFYPQLLMDDDKEVEAVFVSPGDFTVTVNHAGNGSGFTYPLPGVNAWLWGRTTHFAAFPYPGSYFAGWSGDISAGSPYVDHTFFANAEVTATFTDSGHILTVTQQGEGYINPVPGAYPMADGTPITLTAYTTAPFWVFDEWTGDTSGATIDGQTISFTVTGDRAIDGAFRLLPHEVTVTHSGGGLTEPSGIVRMDPGYVNLSATADSAHYFSHWTGDLGAAEPTDNPVSVYVDDVAAFHAVFVAPDFTLTATSIGVGQIAVAQPHHDLGDGIYGYDEEMSAFLTAVNIHDSGYFFSHWAGDIGDASPIATTIELEMDSNRVISAVFMEAPFVTLDVDTVPQTGGGDVVVSPLQLLYAPGTPIELTAEPAEDYVFLQWSGDEDATENPLTLAPVANTSITAQFDEGDHRLVITHEGHGATVPAEGVWAYDDEAVVGLSATGDSGWRFWQWEGDIGSEDPYDDEIDVTMDQDREIRARFAEVGTYEPGEAVTVSLEMIYEGAAPLTALGFLVELPADWDFSETDSTPAPSLVRGPFGEGHLQLAWTTIPSFTSTPPSTTFNLKFVVPATASGTVSLRYRVLYRTDAGQQNTAEHALFLDESSTETPGANATVHLAHVAEAFSVPQPDPEGSPEGEGELLGLFGGFTSFGEGEGEGECDPITVPPVQMHHSADQNMDNVINLTELLRVIQFFNTGGYHCAEGTEDGYAAGPNDAHQCCKPHDSDFSPQNWKINLSELLRLIQIFNVGGYRPTGTWNEEDGFRPGLPLTPTTWQEEFHAFLDFITPSASIESFDSNEYGFKLNGDVAFYPNGIPDGAEFAILQFVLNYPPEESFPYNRGLNPAMAAYVWDHNYARAAVSLGDYDDLPGWRFAVAAYMSIGDFGSVRFIREMAKNELGIEAPMKSNHFRLRLSDKLHYERSPMKGPYSNLTTWEHMTPAPSQWDDYAAVVTGANTNPLALDGGAGGVAKQTGAGGSNCNPDCRVPVYVHVSHNLPGYLSEGALSVVGELAPAEPTHLPHYWSGSTLKVTAKAPPGYVFSEWDAAGTMIDGSTESNESFNVPSHHFSGQLQVRAIFEPEQELTLRWSNGKLVGGTERIYGHVALNCDECTIELWTDEQFPWFGPYFTMAKIRGPIGSTVNLTVTRNQQPGGDGPYFATLHYPGGVHGAGYADLSSSVTLPVRHGEASVRFEEHDPFPYGSTEFTGQAFGSGKVTISVNPQAPWKGTIGSLTTGSGIATALAIPDEGFEFSHWAGCVPQGICNPGHCCPEGNLWTLFENRKSVRATFKPQKTYTITANVRVEGEANASHGCGGEVLIIPARKYYYENETVSLSAMPRGYHFVRWEVNEDHGQVELDVDDPNLNLVVTDNISVTAVMRPDIIRVIVIAGYETSSGGGPNDTGMQNFMGPIAEASGNHCVALQARPIYGQDEIGLDGSGTLFADILIDVVVNKIDKFAFLGHSRGGGAIPDICARLQNPQQSDPHADSEFPEFSTIFTGYVDAIARDPFTTTAPEVRRPAGSEHHSNLFQTITLGTGLNLNGAPTVGAGPIEPNYNINDLFLCVSGANHTLIDDCVITTETLMNYLLWKAAAVPLLGPTALCEMGCCDFDGNAECGE